MPEEPRRPRAKKARPKRTAKKAAKKPAKKAGKKARRMNRGSQQPVLGRRVYERKRGALTGGKAGRPTLEESGVDESKLKEEFLEAIREGLSQATAREDVGVSSSVVERWKAEPPDPDSGMDFRARIAQARSNCTRGVSRALVRSAQGGNVRAQIYYLNNRSREYRGGSGVVPSEAGQQIAAFVGAAMLSQRGNPDPDTMKLWDNYGRDDDDDDDDMNEEED